RPLLSVQAWAGGDHQRTGDRGGGVRDSGQLDPPVLDRYTDGREGSDDGGLRQVPAVSAQLLADAVSPGQSRGQEGAAGIHDGRRGFGRRGLAGGGRGRGGPGEAEA